MRIEGTTYAVNTHVIVNAKREKRIRLSISNREVPYDSIAIVIDSNQALMIVEAIRLGVRDLLEKEMASE